MGALPICESGCKPEDLRVALENGLDPNARWNGGDLGYYWPDNWVSDHSFMESWYLQDSARWGKINTPMHMALANKYFESASLLLEKGADINQPNWNAQTPLQVAIRGRCIDEVRFLVENGCDTKALGFENSVVDGGHELNSHSIRDQRKAIGKAIKHATKSDYRDMNLLSVLLDLGVDANLATEVWTFLDLALINKQEPIMEILVAHKAPLGNWKPISKDVYSLPNQELAEKLLMSKYPFPKAKLHSYYLQLILDADVSRVLEDQSSELSARCQEAMNLFHQRLALDAMNIDSQAPPTTTYCTCCINLMDQAGCEKNNEIKHHLTRNALQESAENGCALCKLLENALANGYRRRCKDDPGEQIRIFPSLSDTLVDSLAVSSSYKRNVLPLSYLDDVIGNTIKSIKDEPLHGTGSSASFETASAWLNYCKKQHECCSGGQNTIPILPYRIIDVSDTVVGPVVMSGRRMRAQYCVLAYAEDESSALPEANASLDPDGPLALESLQPVYRDAISVARQLGFRFIWIDAICLLERERDEFGLDQVRIQDIYLGSTFTISLRASKIESLGLFRPRDQSQTYPVHFPIGVGKAKRNIQRAGGKLTRLFLLPPQKNKVLGPPPEVGGLPWSLVHHYCSKRFLHYGNGLLHWQCFQLNASESAPQGYIIPHDKKQSRYQNTREFNHKEIQRWALMGRGKEIDLSCGELFNSWKAIVRWHTWDSMPNGYERTIGLQCLSRFLEPTLRCKPSAGLWNGEYLLPSLLWRRALPASSRDPHYPSWSWASVGGPCIYPNYGSDLRIVVTDARIDTAALGSLRSPISGGVIITCPALTLPHDFEFWRSTRLYERFGKRNDEIKVNRGSRDVTYAPQGEDSDSRRSHVPDMTEDMATNDITCVIIAKVNKSSCSNVRALGYYQSRPEIVFCLCLKAVDLGDDEDSTDSEMKLFQRIGICEFWDSGELWRRVKGPQTICIL